MSLNRYDMTKVLDDLKLISKAIRVVADENDQTKRLYARGLAQDLLDRLWNDVKEMQDINEKNGKEFGGHVE